MNTRKRLTFAGLVGLLALGGAACRNPGDQEPGQYQRGPGPWAFNRNSGPLGRAVNPRETGNVGGGETLRQAERYGGERTEQGRRPSRLAEAQRQLPWVGRPMRQAQNSSGDPSLMPQTGLVPGQLPQSAPVPSGWKAANQRYTPPAFQETPPAASAPFFPITREQGKSPEMPTGPSNPSDDPARH